MTFVLEVLMNKHLELKNRIRELRIEKGLSQTQLAKMSGTTQNTISSIETGQYGASACTAALICRALECEFADCFYF